MKKPPPRKEKEKPTGPRRLAGELLDVATVAARLGTSEKCIRAQIARQILPHRRLGGRIVVLADELTAYLHALPGVSVEQATQNLRARAAQ